MAEAGLSDWLQVVELLKQNYPDRPPHEAYAEFLDDALTKYPGQVANIIGSIAEPAMKVADEIGEIVGLACGSWKLSAFIKAIRLSTRGFATFYKYLLGISQAKGDSIDGDLDDISNQMAAEILKKFAPTAARSSNPITVGSLKGLLQRYNRPEIYGQISGIFVMMEAVRQIKRLADQAERMSESMAGIERNLESINAQGAYFPNHVHSYVKMMLSNHSTDHVPHYFVVYNRGTLWYPKFAELERDDPLGNGFLGHRTDLDELCAFLAEEVRPRVGEKPVLHILMPTIGPLAIVEAVTFPDAMRPFLIHGERGDSGSQFVWLCTPNQLDRDCLRDIGFLQPRRIFAIASRFGIPLPFLGDYLSFSPGTQYFIEPTFQIPIGWHESGIGYACYLYRGREPPRVLGQQAPPRPWV